MRHAILVGAVLAGLAVDASGALAGGESPAPVVTTVELHTREETVALSADEQNRLAEKVHDLLSRCGFHFVAESGSRSRELEESWTRTRTQAHVYVRFGTPFESGADSGPKVSVEEALVGLADKHFVSGEWSRSHGTITGYGKCFGERALRVMCDAAVRPHLTAEQESNCKVLDSWERTRRR